MSGFMNALYIRAINGMRMCNQFYSFFASFTQTAVVLSYVAIEVVYCHYMLTPFVVRMFVVC